MWVLLWQMTPPQWDNLGKTIKQDVTPSTRQRDCICHEVKYQLLLPWKTALEDNQ